MLTMNLILIGIFLKHCLGQQKSYWRVRCWLRHISLAGLFFEITFLMLSFQTPENHYFFAFLICFYLKILKMVSSLYFWCVLTTFPGAGTNWQSQVWRSPRQQVIILMMPGRGRRKKRIFVFLYFCIFQAARCYSRTLHQEQAAEQHQCHTGRGLLHDYDDDICNDMLWAMRKWFRVGFC